MKNYLWSLIVLFSCAFVACDDDDVTPDPVRVPDTVNPVIDISLPESNSDLMVFEHLKVRAEITDNAGLEEVRLFVVYPNGTRNKVEGLEYLKSIQNTYAFLHLTMRLPKNSEIGTYTVVLEAEDMRQNEAKDSVSFSLHAPDLSMDDFIEAFIQNGFIVTMANWEENFLSKQSFNSGFFYVLDKDDGDQKVLKAEWEKFVLDFGIRKQSWGGWDVNNDDFLTIEEFDNGLSKTKLFDEWDLNKDAILDEQELATGVFSRWDKNTDDKLTRAEYEELLNTYFYF